MPQAIKKLVAGARFREDNGHWNTKDEWVQDPPMYGRVVDQLRGSTLVQWDNGERHHINQDAQVEMVPLAEGRKVADPARINAARFSKQELRYTATKNLIGLTKRKDARPFKGQANLVFSWYLACQFKKSPTAEELTADLVAAGFAPNQDPVRAIYYVLNEWKKKGLLQT